MSPSVVLTAEQPENDSASGAMAKDTERGRCILLSAPLAAKTARCHSSPEAADRCTARIATPPLGGSDKKGMGMCECAHSSFLLVNCSVVLRSPIPGD